jgi:hypothetical protein
MAALGLMAVTAAGAQAKGDWRVNGVTTTGTIGVLGVVDPGSDFTLLSSFGASNTPIAILCKTLTTDDGLLFVGGGSLATLLFTACETFLKSPPELSKPCKPAEPIVAKVKDLLILHNGKTYDLFSPDEGTTFATIKLGEECAAGENVPVTGSLVAQCLWNNGGVTTIGCEHEEVSHLIEQAPAALFPSDTLSFGTHAASLDGAANLHLGAPNVNALWSGLGL